MTIIWAILITWLALNVAIFADMMLRHPRLSREDRRWLKLHPGMSLTRRPYR
jgi:hypothetical protein